MYLFTDGPNIGVARRTSDDPEHFPAESEERFHFGTSRPALSFDPFASVWRFSFDVGYDAPTLLVQSWADSALSDAAALHARAAPIHEPLHALHAEIHAEAVGALLQSTNAIYPTPDDVVFFYTGIGTSTQMRVFAQGCTRR
jgi:hypothetical protein